MIKQFGVMIPSRTVAFALCIALCTVICQPLLAGAAEKRDKAALKVTSAPGFAARSVQGAPISSDKLRGKAYIVNFFGSWCPVCRKELPDMVALQEKYEKKGFTFIGMAYKDNAQSLPDFIWEHSINYPVVVADHGFWPSDFRRVEGCSRIVCREQRGKTAFGCCRRPEQSGI